MKISLYMMLYIGCLATQACQGSTSPGRHPSADTSQGQTPSPGSRRPQTADTSGQNLAGDFAAPSRLHFDSAQLNGFFKKYPAFKSLENEIRTFYQPRRYAYAWVDRSGLTELAGNLYNRVRQLPEENPSASLPYRSSLDSLMESESPPSRTNRLNTELLLSSAYFYFAKKAWTGIDASQTQKMAWFIPRKKADYAWWLNQYAAGTTTRDPVFRQYDLLKEFLLRYRDLEKQSRWPQLHLANKKEPDSILLRAVRQRLILLGDLDANTATSQPYANTAATQPHANTADSAALRRFQQRMGLAADGKLGPATLRALNITPKERITQILVNMERSRWVPDSVSGNYLAVNIPEFRLHAYYNDSLLWDMRVVVGKSMHKTVIFSGTLKDIVFSPYWNVPPGILRNEVLPGIARDQTYLARHHMERYGNGVRQKPGPWNSLGGVKFLFPNSHAIYLHDTPSKDLFNESSRAFSHGCVRVAEPAKLAAWLLRSDPNWTAARIDESMHLGKERWVKSPGDVRVFIVYFTAWVDHAGRLNFRNDLYSRDRRLAALVAPN